MSEPTEMSVTVKGETENGEDATYKQNFILYDPYMLVSSDPVVKDCVSQTLLNSKIKPDSISIRAHLQVQ